MKKTFSAVFTILIVAFLIAGFAMMSDNNGSRTNSSSTGEPVASETDATAIYTDNFDGANDTTALKNRGYGVFRRGPGPPGLTAIWFQGNNTVFPAFNGPPTGYVAANYNSSVGNNAIDNWMVLPYQSGGYIAGDSLYFYSRSPLASTYPDSMKVMYSETDSIPEGTWVMLGRFKVTTGNEWEQKGFRVPTTSTNGRLAIRYGCVNGGPNGLNTDYSGIDAMRVERNTTGIHITSGEVPAEFTLSQNYPNPFNPVTNIAFSIPQSGLVTLKVYDISGKEMAVLVNQQMLAGSYRVDFDASSLSSGVYFYKLSSENYSATKKMVLIK
ncbi:MAG: T9SS type A sorting domain-containing protein [Chlorobi bacterium]|nr:T9SS type A sorting domain-containing protein [Chlorobiota bacterium]